MSTPPMAAFRTAGTSRMSEYPAIASDGWILIDAMKMLTDLILLLLSGCDVAGRSETA